MLAGTTYFWRVDSTIGGHTLTGETLRFDTRVGIEVTTASDENDGMAVGGVSLREAIADAALAGPPETIRFAPALSGATLTLSNGELAIAKSLSIDASDLVEGITISGNNASRIFNVSAGVIVELDTLTLTGGNSGSGGAIYVSGSTLTVRNSTITGNTAIAGGGLYSDTDLTTHTTTLINCTVANNTATTGGGGIRNQDGITELTHCTISGNSAPIGEGSGVASYGDAFTETKVFGSIIAGNNNGDVDWVLSTLINSFTSLGSNLIGTGEALADFNQASDQVGIADALLGPLGNYGGPTETMSHVVGSPAIDMAVGSVLTLDQRGVDRPAGLVADIGAVEVLARAATPASGTLNTSLLPTLAWTGPAEATFELFLGASPDALISQGMQASPFVVTDPLLAGTTYYWRVDTTLGGNLYQGSVMHFSSRDGIEVTTITDENDGFAVGAASLREAIAEAAPTEVIRFAAALDGQTIVLTAGELVLTKSLTIDASALAAGITISGNNSSRIFNVSAGAIVELDTLTLTGGNSDKGGAINVLASTLTVRNSTIAGNTATSGGGLYSDTDLTTHTTTLINCTVANNTATTSGGGIRNQDGITELTHCTISGNSAPIDEGSGVASYGDGATETKVFGSIIAGNSNGDVDLVASTSNNSFTSLGSNLIGSGEALADFNLASDKVGIADALLASLGDYGGPTETMPPLVGSPALDAAVGSVLASDQRGIPRPFESAPDIGAVEAVYFTVLNTNNTGAGSLRSALAQAATFGSFPGVLVFFDESLSGETISLASVLTINSSLRLDGSALADGITISAAGVGRVFVISGGVEVFMNSLTIRDGNMLISEGQGGGIAVYGSTLTLSNSTLVANTALRGGGIYSSNYETDHTTTLINCTLTDNEGTLHGGAVYTIGSRMELIHCTITGNRAPSGEGGGVASWGDATTETTVFASIITGNGNGDVDSVVRSSKNSFTSLGSNLIGSGDALAAFNQSSDLIGIADARLAALSDNGGPTATIMLMPGSPAIDVVMATTLSTDQRGFERVLGSAADVGAYEASAGDYTLAGLTIRASVDPSLNADDFEFEISADPNFYATVSSFAGTGTSGSSNGQRSLADFNYPSGVAQDSFGNIFVADSANNLIRMVSPSGAVTTIAGSGIYGDSNGSGPNAQFKFPVGIAVGGLGLREDLYVTDLFGHRVRKITRPAVAGQNWTVSTLAGNGTAGFQNGAGSAARFNYPYGVAVDDLGNVYVADAYNHRIRKINVNASVSTYAGPNDTVTIANSAGYVEGSANNARFNEPVALAFDSLGSLYVADRNNHSIRKITAGGVVSNLAGGGPSLAGFVPATGSDARFDSPNGLVVDASNNLYVADGGNHAIRKVTTPGGVVTNVAGLGSAGMLDGNATVALFDGLTGLLVDHVNFVGDLIVADSGNHRLRRVVVEPIRVKQPELVGGVLSAVLDVDALGLDPNIPYYIRWRYLPNSSTQALGQSFFLVEAPTVTTLAATAVARTSATVNASVNPHGSPTTVTFKYSTNPELTTPLRVDTLVDGFTAPRGMAVDSSGNVYVADRDRHYIVKVTSDGAQSIFAGNGTAGYINGLGAAAQFDHPVDLAIDANDNLYVADEFNHSIRKITSGGLVSTVAGSGLAGFADASVAVSGQLLFPSGVAVNAAGSKLYIADRGNHRIRLVSGGALSTLAGNGSTPLVNGLAGQAQFNNPTGVALDLAGNVVVADRDNHCIRLITNGSVVTAAGSGVAGFNDGAKANAQFASPITVAVDANGDIFVTDRDNQRLRKIRGSTVSTVAGSGVAGSLDSPDSNALYPATHARFDRPFGLAVGSGAMGTLYLSEEGSGRIRTITRGSEPLTVTWSGLSSADSNIIVDVPLPETLLGGTTYYFQATATNARNPVEPTVGAILSFVTPTDKDIAVFAGPDMSSLELLDAQTTAIDFGTTPQGLPLTRSFTIANVGEVDLLVSAISATAGVLITGGLGTLTPGASSTFEAMVDDSAGGNFAETIIITSDDPDENSFEIPVSWIVLAPPTVVTLDASGLTTNSATLNATVHPEASTTTAWFEYSTDPNLDGFTVSTGTATQLNQARGIAIDAAGNRYVADTANHRIRKIASDGTVTTLAGTGVAGFANGAVDSAQFNEPIGIVINAGGTLFVADSQNHLIRAISPLGQVSTYAGFGYGNAGFTDGVAGAARFNLPSGLAIDSDGVLYVADRANHRIRKVAVGGLVSTLTGTGQGGELDAPIGIARSQAGTIYFTEASSNRIGQMTSGGTVSSLISSGSALQNPAGLAIDAENRLYVADTGNHRIRRVLTQESVSISTIAGSGIAGNADGGGDLATFNQPAALAINAAGEVFVAELGNTRLRRIKSTTVRVEVAADLEGALSDAPTPLTLPLFDLAEGARYYFRALASNGGGSTFGEILNFEILLTSSFATWQADKFGVDADNPAIAAWNADASGDGVINLFKYAFGLDPNINTQDGLPVITISGGSLQMTYNKALVATDLEFLPQWSANLTDWYSIGITQELLGTDAGVQSIRATIPIGNAPAKFLRLRINFLQP